MLNSGLIGWLRSSPAFDSLWPFGTLLLRVYIGLVVTMQHGLPKLMEMFEGHGHFLELVRDMGLPAPVPMAWMAALTQVLGGIAVAMGLATRPAALGVASTIGVGVISVHWNDGFHAMEAGFAYVVSMIVIAVVGAGPISLDRLLDPETNSL